MKGFSAEEIVRLRNGDIQVFGVKMAILKPELAERARNMAIWGEWALEGAEYIDASFVAKSRQCFLDLLRKDIHPTTDWSTLKQFEVEEAINLLERQKEGMKLQIRTAICKILNGESGCERLLGMDY
jgi:hypothetical protein